jgi:catechol 2,3-dioxygenase-like lactoylglutathione lyase family enzyme
MGKGLDHICVVSPDLEKSVDFYTRVLGFTCILRETMESQGIAIARVEYLGDVIELVTFLRPRPGFHYGDGLIEMIGISVPDVRAEADALRSNGVECLMDEPVMTPGGGFFFFRGPSGEKLELVQSGGAV